MILIQVWSRNVLETSGEIDIESANYETEIEYLHKWMPLVHKIVSAITGKINHFIST